VVSPSDLYARPNLEDRDVQHLLARVGSTGGRDLGGSMSLNVHLEELGLVVRVHPRFEAAARLRTLRTIRRRLADQGLSVGAPQKLLGEELVEVGDRFAEAETFVEAERPAPTWASYLWMYEAAGRLHSEINVSLQSLAIPEPDVATYATPPELRRWMAATSVAVGGNEEAAAIAAEVRALIETLEQQWIEPQRLPQQLVHGDGRLGNFAQIPNGETAYFDFGFAARRPRIHELAYSLLWIVLKPDDSGLPGEFDWPRVRELVDAYETAADRNLDDLERRALGPYLAMVPMYLASISSYTPEPCDRIKQERRSLEIARWVLDHPGAILQ
jgi:Ser/Thr protein kinase RdoA (MazF antagonist)